tara:strand:- start:42 stop:863 length:822 start_codon:yes stop_codon:yes gene_type:complete
MLDTLFDKIYVVWGRDPARKEYIQNHLRVCNIENYELVRSIIPDNLFIKNKSSRKKIRFKKLWAASVLAPVGALNYNLGGLKKKQIPYPMSLAEICCTYGHLKAWKTAIKDGVNNFLILEDDAILDDDICKNALEWKEYIPSNWDALHFHSWRSFDSIREPELAKKRTFVNDYFYTGFKEYSGAVCYSLTTNIAKQLLSRFYPITLISDGIIGTLSDTIFSRNFYNVYVFHPFLSEGTFSFFESQIDSEIQYSKKFITRQQRYAMNNFNSNIL